MPNRKRCHDFDAYVAAHQRAYFWAEKALRYRSAGKFAQAKAAVERSNQWLRHLAMLVPQPRTAHPPAIKKRIRGNLRK
jgi:hypothetical protein